ncbi:hypothetical protein [Brasilonema bromeliae]|nr:hypothetical protein [Brasilonema bromeliae]
MTLMYRSQSLAGNNAFPDGFRENMDNFWASFVTLPKKALETVDR